MSKQEDRNNSNVIPFPNLKERLIQLGAEALQNHEPEEAIDYLEQALQYDAEDERILWALIASYMEIKEWNKAKGICQEMLHKGIGSYYMVFETYIKTLIELRQFEEANRHISVLLEEQGDELNPNVRDRLEKLLSFIEKRKNRPEPSHDSLGVKMDDAYWFQHLQLFQQDIRPFIKEIEIMLNEPDRHPFIKSVILHALIEQKYDHPISVSKFGKKQTLVPKEEEGFNGQIFYQKLISLLKERLEHENPSLLTNLKQLIERHFFILFPFQMEPIGKEEAWACAYHIKGMELYGLEVNQETMIDEYVTSMESVTTSMNQIQMLESIPFPEL
ncbi:tetratricopeptide repeat protein [Bacillus litorisediminis]|uniref:tetratricopeptide repeat protein n=1 Tax=Bacillus litorisediminis TaxID=2922713 RepID=UPI001FAFD594|nr:tetratricopeptide repeat protein [Bacillus litorisediminis]